MRLRVKAIWLTTVCAGALIFVAALGNLSSAAREKLPSTSSSEAAASGMHFEDITRAAGIHFVHNNGGFGKKWLPETMGSGVAFLDYDNDGWQDILFVNGADWPGHAQRRSTLADRKSVV